MRAVFLDMRPFREIAEEFDIPIPSVVQIKQGRHWKKETAGLTPGIVRVGLRLAGEGSPRHVLTEQGVRLIRESKLSNQALAQMLGVTPGAISHVRNRTTWKHIP